MEHQSLSTRELRRYAKQIMLEEIGISGQEKLKNASVLVVGAGGLGCSVLQYLTVAGTGTIGIAEYDMVDESNLQRQVLYGSNDLGKLKSVIAKNRLENLNTLVGFEVFNLTVNESNALRLFDKWDIIVDATDNLRTRYIINDSCVILDKPMVHGSIYKYEGMVSVFNYKGGATYRCFNPLKKGVKHRNPLPAQTGLFGVIPGIAGTLMANEVIKIITGAGEVLSGKILHFNIMRNSFRMIKVVNIPENHDAMKLRSEFE